MGGMLGCAMAHGVCAVRVWVGRFVAPSRSPEICEGQTPKPLKP